RNDCSNFLYLSFFLLEKCILLLLLIYNIVLQLYMAQKRSFEDQLPNDASTKHPRQMGERDLNVSHVDMFSLKAPSGKDILLGKSAIMPSDQNFMVNDLERRNISANGSTPGVRDDEEDNNAEVPRSLSLFPWAASSTSEECYSIDHVAPLPFPKTECFRFDRLVNSPLRAAASPLRATASPLRTAASSLYADNLYSVLDNPPRKSVPIGPDHQADIPVLSETTSLRDNYDELAGNSLIFKNDLGLPPYIKITEGTGRTNCDCLDMGSIRCVRQHIMESREKLMTTLGQEAFLELGFREMGEVVSDKWSKDEQRVFHKVVHCNPFSLGNNFWSVLSAVFPSRTKMEIVSYYFNVFILQKRAEQNRHDPTNIDSDNDEWQLSDDGFESTDDDDSAPESPVYHDDNDSNDHIDYPLDEHELASHRNVSSKFSCDLGGMDLLEKRHNNDDNDHHLMENNHHNFSDSVPQGELPHGSPECGRVWQDFILEPCDTKTWDDYATCPKNELDFLPTCSMIQEVFGDGPLDSDAKRR
ncbi:hypothetical protein V2J09_021150, partial [Rumex salicifolius]